jgi:hypothetical protein
VRIGNLTAADEDPMVRHGFAYYDPTKAE